MHRDIFPYMKHEDGKVAIIIEMDKDAFDHLLWSYKAAWAKPRRDRYWGEDIVYFHVIKEILEAMEKGCVNDQG